MADGKVRIGVIGTGGMGSGHCSMMDKIPEAQLAAVCDINPAARPPTRRNTAFPPLLPI